MGARVSCQVKSFFLELALPFFSCQVRFGFSFQKNWPMGQMPTYGVELSPIPQTYCIAGEHSPPACPFLPACLLLPTDGPDSTQDGFTGRGLKSFECDRLVFEGFCPGKKRLVAFTHVKAVSNCLSAFVSYRHDWNMVRSPPPFY